MSPARKRSARTDDRQRQASRHARSCGADEVPDVSPRRAAWKYALLAGIFLAWCAVLLYCALTGTV